MGGKIGKSDPPRRPVDESPPFDGPGWGCEDVDLAFQMHGKGFYSQVLTGMT